MVALLCITRRMVSLMSNKINIEIASGLDGAIFFFDLAHTVHTFQSFTRINPTHLNIDINPAALRDVMRLLLLTIN